MDRSNLTFAQAEGAEPLPTQLQLKTVSPELSALLWVVVFESLDNYIWKPTRVYYNILHDPWRAILRDWWIFRLFRNVDEFPSADNILAIVKSTITSREYVIVFDFIQFVIRHPRAPDDFKSGIENALQVGRAPYRLIDNTIVPISSDEEADAVRRAMRAAQNAEPQGPYAHLRAAADGLSSGQWAETIRESIHAVEAAAKFLEPSASTLGPALTKLQKNAVLSPALAKAFSALYGYTSDEKGVRHALVFDGQANVAEKEAIFMFGACASFVGYLLATPKIE